MEKKFILRYGSFLDTFKFGNIVYLIKICLFDALF